MIAELATARRVLVITKFRYLGDTIVATPFLRHLRAALPGASITVLAGPAIAALLKGCPYVDAFWEFDPGASRAQRSIIGLIHRLRAGAFDAVFLLNRSLHSAVAAALARIPIRIGHNCEHRGPLLTHRVPYFWTKPDRDCALDLLRAACIPADMALPELWVSPQERDEARALLTSRGVTSMGPLVGVQPGANDPEVREWGTERFATVADRLCEQFGARIVLLGATSESRASELTAGAMRVAPTVLTGETTLRQALAVISLCRLWVGNDGGLLHAAVALGPATVGIFGPTKAPRWAYDTPRHRTMVMYPQIPARDSRTIRRCLDSITVEDVYETAARLLAEDAESCVCNGLGVGRSEREAG